jgi:Ca2+:H+ antiporter
MLHTADVGFSYIVLVAGFYYAPSSAIDDDQGHELLPEGGHIISLTFWESMKWYITSWW